MSGHAGNPAVALVDECPERVIQEPDCIAPHRQNMYALRGEPLGKRARLREPVVVDNSVIPRCAMDSRSGGGKYDRGRRCLDEVSLGQIHRFCLVRYAAIADTSAFDSSDLRNAGILPMPVRTIV